VGERGTLILNDRADLALAADCAGVHLGQDDLSAEGARVVAGERLLIGVSCHNLEQVASADAGPANYIAIGPVFATTSKAWPDPVVGLEGVRAARSLTRKPLVVIGGITRANCRSVIEAGADSVAVISDLVAEPKKAAQDFLRLLK
jgi:thiamine-phosphate pyrophosphorylase